MMLPLPPAELDRLIQERQGRLHATPRPVAIGAGWRVRIGRALIAAGVAVGGERVEPARNRSLSPTTH